MSKPKVVIVGCTGMLGAMTLDHFVRSNLFDVIGTYREGSSPSRDVYSTVEFRSLDAETASVDDIVEAIKDAEWVVNAIGIIKPYIHDDNADEVERAIRVNGLFPYLLGKAAAKSGAKVIQIATDCVYSGEQGGYVEADLHDALDVYGKSKSLGEARLSGMYHVRCSIIGPERKAHRSLMDWFLGLPAKAEVTGFTNHHWNGLTTLHFAKLSAAIIHHNIALPHLQHIVPGNQITKANLLHSFAKEYNRPDIIVRDAPAPEAIDRTLSTTGSDVISANFM